MRILRNPARTSPCVLVLGMFDGVHRGHQQLLMTGNALAEAEGITLRVCTFSPHPLAVLCPDKAPKMLTTLPERARFMLGYGVDSLCVFSFTRAMADEAPEDFVRRMVRTFQPRHVVVGFNNTFGQGGRGDGALLTAMGRELGFSTHIVPAVELDGAPVSSTRIRGLLAQGDIHGATRLLGHAYTLSGRVMDGKHIGRTMGYPTANVDVPQRKVLPAFGVYACYLTVEGHAYPAVVNVGRHPTLPEGAVTVEAHVLDACLMLYGKKVRLDFLNFQRSERKFDGVDALKAQIQADSAQARAFFRQWEHQ